MEQRNVKAKSNFLFLLLFAFLVITVFGCMEDNHAVTGVTLDQSEHTMFVGEDFTLTASVEPHNATNQEVVWSTSGSGVAIVSNGRVEAKAPGLATITVTTVDGGKTDRCIVTVQRAPVVVNSVTLDKESYELSVNEEFTLTATIVPFNATNRALVWTSGNPDVATVNDGAVTGISEGVTTITVTTVDGGKTAQCVVTVTFFHVSSVKFSQTSYRKFIGDDAFTLTAIIEPPNASNKELVWTSSNPGVATVDAGKVEIKDRGETTITVTTVDGNHTATCEITVVNLSNLLKNPGFEEPAAVAGSYGAGEAPQDWEMVTLEWFQTYPPYMTGAGPLIGTLGGVVCTPDRIGPNYDPFEPPWWGSYCNWYTRFVTSSFVARSAFRESGGLYQIVDVIPNETYEFGVSIGYGQAVGGASVKPHETLKILSPDGMTTYHAEPIPAREVAPQWHVWRPDTYEVDFPGIGAACWCSAPIRVEGTVTIPAGVTQIRFQIDQRHFTETNLNAPVMLWDDCVFALVKED